MISRRAFLSALACLPYVGTYVSAALTAGDTECRLVPAPREVREITLSEQESVEIEFEPIVIDGRVVGYQRCWSPGPWDRKDQA